MGVKAKAMPKQDSDGDGGGGAESGEEEDKGEEEEKSGSSGTEKSDEEDHEGAKARLAAEAAYIDEEVDDDAPERGTDFAARKDLEPELDVEDHLAKVVKDAENDED